MQSTPVVVIARLQAAQGKEAALAVVLEELVQRTAHHDGMLRYELHSDPNNPCAFLFTEQWRDKAALDAHLAHDDFVWFGAQLAGLLADEPEVRLWQLRSVAGGDVA